MEKPSVVFVIIGVLGLIIAAVGLAMFPVFKNIVSKRIEKNVPLVNGSSSYNNWLNPSSPVYMQFWVFDVQNPEDIVNKGSKPIVVTKGPYTYREIRPKDDVTFLNNDTQISYVEPKAYVFEPDMSNGTEEDRFTNVNLPILTAANMLAGSNFLVREAFKIAINHYGERLFETHSVHDYLWGYEEKTFAAINNITKKYLNITVFPSDKFGLFSGPTGNGTDDGTYVINTGTDDVSKINTIDSWKGSPNVSYWTTDYCNMINGTDATMYHPFIKKDETLYIFSSDICRSIYVKYQKEMEVNGIKLLRFTPPADVFADHNQNPDNIGFCVPDQTHCLGSGVLDVSKCKSGAPLIVSQPHFYQGDQKYIDAIVGMNPSSEFETFIDVEPLTGVAMHVAKKLQINAMIKKVSTFSDTNLFVNGTILPILMLNESAIIGDEDASRFKSEVMKPINMLDIIKWSLVGVGAALILAFIIYMIVTWFRNRKDPDLLLVNSDELAGDS